MVENNNKPLLDYKERGSTLDDIEEVKVSDLRGNPSKARQSLLLDGFPDASSTSPENQFKSLYSFQTFKWLILQAQAQQITVEELQIKALNMERTVSKLASETSKVKEQMSLVLQRLDTIQSKMPEEAIVAESELKNAIVESQKGTWQQLS